MKTQATREGLTLTYTHGAANRPLSVVPSGTPGTGMAPNVLAKAEVFDWRIAGQGGNSDFRRRFKVEYESAKAAIDTLGGLEISKNFSEYWMSYE